MDREVNPSSWPDAGLSDGRRDEPAKLEYAAQDMMPTSRPSLLRHSWQLLVWLPMIVALVGALLLPLISRRCAALK